MGTWGARKLARIVVHTRQVLAIELLEAGQGIDFRRPLTSSTRVERVHSHLREKVARLAGDRLMAGDIAVAAGLVDGLGQLALADRVG